MQRCGRVLRSCCIRAMIRLSTFIIVGTLLVLVRGIVILLPAMVALRLFLGAVVTLTLRRVISH
jgi:hypothetical protein